MIQVSNLKVAYLGVSGNVKSRIASRTGNKKHIMLRAHHGVKLPIAKQNVFPNTMKKGTKFPSLVRMLSFAIS